MMAQTKINIKKAYNYALYLLSAQEYSSNKIKQKIKNKYPELSNQNILDIINKLINQNYLSDKRYSEIKTRSLIRRSYGIYYIKKYLQQEKIEENIINQSIQNSINEQNIYWPDNIKNYLNKYNYDYLDNSPKYKKKWQNKLYNRGFEQTDINKILFKWEK